MMDQLAEMNNLYGNFRNRTFCDIFPDKDTFFEQVKNCGLDIDVKDQSIIQTYLLLYSRYGNSTIASSDENRFKYNLYSIMFSYAPTWEKRLEMQKFLRHASDDEILKGSTTITNVALNPQDEPSTSSTEELDYINSQNATHFRNSKLGAYAMLENLLKTDVTQYYLDHFEDLFIKFVMPEKPLWYTTPEGGR